MFTGSASVSLLLDVADALVHMYKNKLSSISCCRYTKEDHPRSHVHNVHVDIAIQKP